MQKAKVIITGYEQDGLIVTVDFGEESFKLQHPGNRAKMEMESRFFNLQKLDRAGFLDYCFDNVVIPLKGERPTLDNIHPVNVEVWSELLRRFLDGIIDPPITKQSTTNQTSKRGGDPTTS